MPIVLTVDDSSSIRAIVGKALQELGFEIEQAEDGARGLALLETTRVDLILLDVTMPVMDGPAMLKALRERGDRTPVIMLTSESKRTIVAGAMQLGIEDYMLKPFKPDELRTKVFKALRLPAAPAPTREPATRAPVRATTDVLIVDDMEHVHKKLRQLLPEHVTMHGAVDAADAVARCQERGFRLILIDLVIPGVDSLALMIQLRALQPQAAFLAVVLRTAGDAHGELAAAGFVDQLCKPFEPQAISALVVRVFEARDLIELDGNVLTATGCESKDERIDTHYDRLRPALKQAIEALAAACHDDVVLDLRRVPLRATRTVRMIIDVDKDAHRLGLRLRLVCTSDTASLLRRVADTADVSVFDTVDHARGMAP